MKQLSLFDKIIFSANSIFTMLLFLSCAVPYISVKSIPSIAFLSLTVPILVIVNILFLLYWLLRRKKQLLLPFLGLFLGYFFLGSFFQFKFSGEPILEDDLSIMSYNARIFNRFKWNDDASLSDQIVDFVEDQNPDIICFQEFDYGKKDQFDQYPYSHIAQLKGKVIQTVFSKYPIVSKGVLHFPETPNSAVYVDILYKNDTVRIYNLHLQSLKIRPNTVMEEASGKLYRRLSKSFVKQGEQAEIFNKHRNATSYKKIVCGDFNNNQFSNVYRTIKGDMQDTFDEMGSGYGRTYNFKYFPVRIDFILADPIFEVRAHKNYDVKLSDHFPVMASVRFQSQ